MEQRGTRHPLKADGSYGGFTRRSPRLLLTEYLRRHMHDLLGYGLGMEMLALLEKPEAR